MDAGFGSAKIPGYWKRTWTKSVKQENLYCVPHNVIRVSSPPPPNEQELVSGTLKILCSLPSRTMLLCTFGATANHCWAATRGLAGCSWHAVGLKRLLVHQASDQNQHAAAQGASSEQHCATHGHQQHQQQLCRQACNWQPLPHISRAVLPALGPLHSSSSSSRGFASTSASAEAGDEGDVPRRRRRGTTESRAAMRRTTVRAVYHQAVHDASGVACTRNV